MHWTVTSPLQACAKDCLLPGAPSKDGSSVLHYVILPGFFSLHKWKLFILSFIFVVLCFIKFLNVQFWKKKLHTIHFRPPVFSHSYRTLSFPEPFFTRIVSLKISLSEESFQDVSVSISHILSDVVEEKQGLGTERLNLNKKRLNLIYEKSQLAEKDWKSFLPCFIQYMELVVLDTFLLLG